MFTVGLVPRMQDRLQGANRAGLLTSTGALG
jgi:hypothetical protein